MTSPVKKCSSSRQYISEWVVAAVAAAVAAVAAAPVALAERNFYYINDYRYVPLLFGRDTMRCFLFDNLMYTQFVINQFEICVRFIHTTSLAMLALVLIVLLSCRGISTASTQDFFGDKKGVRCTYTRRRCNAHIYTPREKCEMMV
ncbi:unnamed protein product [Trichogramma brassicae]|uniref:Uncharacterized protein n=1 Tax=Trichogramma brassicae TaxID=86971 RepID=A0A6H5IQW7_9HYME|nr:unnamed protein product [Trichogramma brassicae]